MICDNSAHSLGFFWITECCHSQSCTNVGDKFEDTRFQRRTVVYAVDFGGKHRLELGQFSHVFVRVFILKCS